MDDVAEQQEIANEISEAISNPVGFGQDMDEVSAELSKSYSHSHLSLSLFRRGEIKSI